MPTVSNFLRSVREGAQALFSEELWLTTSVLFLPVLYMTAALALLSDTGLGRWVFPAGLLLWGGVVVLLHRDERWQRLAATLLLFLIAFALVAFLTGYTLDKEHESRLYHARAILGLLEGVNPYREPADWVSLSYPAAHWLISAPFILWTRSFETGLTFTVVAAFAAFLCARRFFACLPCLSRSRLWRNLLAFLLAFNPIATWCFFNHHVDGLLASTLLSVSMLMLCVVLEDRGQSRKTRLRTAFCVAALLVLLINLKFTGLVFGGVLGLTALVYGMRRGTSRETLLRLAGLGSAAAILGVLLFGFFPYATNVKQGKNPFYPAVSVDEKGNRTDIYASYLGKEFHDKSHYEKWWISLFSRNGKDNWNPAPLPPFSSLSARSFQYGFSSFFSGALLLCLMLAFFVRHKGAWVVLAGVMISILSTGASFEFRLSPQNWWLPLLFLAFVLERPAKSASLSRAPLLTAKSIAGCMCAIALIRFLLPGLEAVYTKHVAEKLAQEGGWHVTGFFHYYNSGLTGINLPALEKCPQTAESRKLTLFAFACRP